MRRYGWAAPGEGPRTGTVLVLAGLLALVLGALFQASGPPPVKAELTQLTCNTSAITSTRLSVYIRYDVNGTINYRWREAGTSSWDSSASVGGGTPGTLRNFELTRNAEPDTTYEIRAHQGGSFSDPDFGITCRTKPVPNHAPVFSETTLSLGLPHDTAAGGSFGDAVTATDQDGDTLTYTLGGTDASSFSISSAGQLSLASGVSPGAVKTTYNIIVTVRDTKNASDTISVTITVTGPFAPEIAGVSSAGVVSVPDYYYVPGVTNTMYIHVCDTLQGGGCVVSTFTLSNGSRTSFDVSDNSNWPGGGVGTRYVRARTLNDASYTAYSAYTEYGLLPTTPVISSVSVAGVVTMGRYFYQAGASNILYLYVCNNLEAAGCVSSSFTLSGPSETAFDISGNSNWDGLSTRHVRARTLNNVFSQYSPFVSFIASEQPCREANNPPYFLGELPLAAGSVLTHSGYVSGSVDDAPCTDADGHSAVYLRFAVAAGEDGAVKVEARRGTSGMKPDLLMRSGDAYTGAALFRDIRSSEDDALASGLVDAGTYTLQLRAGTALAGEPEGAGGPYSVTITRLQPSLTSSSAQATSISTMWDVGAATSTGSGNQAGLAVKVEYREDSEQTWTTADASLIPMDQTQTVTSTVTGLTFGYTYHVRAAYTNSGQYIETGGILTRANILLSGAPYGVEADAVLVDEATHKYEIRAAWETPPIVADDNIQWGYATRIDGGRTVPNAPMREHVQETVFLYEASAVRGGVLTVEVINAFECLAPDESEANPWTSCSLTYNERDYMLPVGSYWSTPWSAPALVQIAAPAFTAGTTAMDEEPEQAVTQAIDLLLGIAGVDEEDRPSKALSVLLCTALALSAGVGIAHKTGGMKLAPVLWARGSATPSGADWGRCCSAYPQLWWR